MKIIGGLIIAWGVLDFGLSWMNTDLYGEIGINVSATIYPYTAYIAGIIGAVLYHFGTKIDQNNTDQEGA